MDKGYAKMDLSGSYRIQRSLKWYASVENLLNQKYEAAAGFPALPATFRTGVSVLFGGDAGRP
jgi:iron complex outermembrane receptor protein/vitamin B12 transporter